MTKIITALFLLASATGYAQSEKYTEAMKKNLSRFDSVKTTEELQSLSATFERIGDAEKNRVAPLLLFRPCFANTGLDRYKN